MKALQHLAHACDGGGADPIRPPHHHDRQRKGARRRDLAIGGSAAAVLGDHDLDALGAKQGAFVCFRERASRQHGSRVGEPWRKIGRIDAANEEVMLPMSREGGELLPSHRKENALGVHAKTVRGLLHVRSLDPFVAVDGRPDWAFQNQKRNVGPLGGSNGIGRDASGEGMRGIENRVDTVLAYVSGQPIDATETADAHGNVRQDRRTRSSGQRQHDVASSRGLLREFAGLAGAAEDQDSVHAAE